MTWQHHATTITSKGSTAAKANSLADLHRRRQESQGQFYTPPALVNAQYRLLEPELETALMHGGKVRLLDNSVGSGRMLAPATPDRFCLYGVEPDPRCIDALSRDAHRSGFEQYQFIQAGMEQVDVAHMSLGTINPPYSLQLSSPTLADYPSCCMGRFGPHSSSLSHLYAVYQALESCDAVVAILPKPALSQFECHSRLCTVYELPRHVFDQEGARVKSVVLVFGRLARKGEVLRASVTLEQRWPALPASLSIRSSALLPKARFHRLDESADRPTITLPVTGDPRVTLHHHGRRLVLKYRCGFTQARVENALREEPVPSHDGLQRHRYPKGIRFCGDGRYLLDSLLCQRDPDAALAELLTRIRHADGEPALSPTLKGYWRRLKRQHAIHTTPYRKWIMTGESPTVTLTAHRGGLLIPGQPHSGVVMPGQQLTGRRHDSEITLDNGVTLGFDDAARRFTIEEDGSQPKWRLIEPGRTEAFPTEAGEGFRAMQRAGVDFLWDFQRQTVCEQLISPLGGVCSSQQGTGKARMALAIAMAAPGRALLLVEAGLIPEMLAEMDKIGLDRNQVHLLRPGEESACYHHKITLTSYHTLRQPRCSGAHRSASHRLRRCFATVLADEGGLLSNPGSLQSQAVARLAARRLIVFDGTVLNGYARKVLPIAAATVGHARAHQPYGIHSLPFVTPSLLTSASYGPRGIDAFANQFVMLDWATHEFREGLDQGAKREIPRLPPGSEPAFRDWLNCFVQRRLRAEPELRDHCAVIPVQRHSITVPWDRDHLAHFIKTAVEFQQWYEPKRRQAKEEGRVLSLVEVLARLDAVVCASDAPSEFDKGAGRRYLPVTSKQRKAAQLAAEAAQQGRKAIIYVRNPAIAYRIVSLLTDMGVSAMPFTGREPIKTRTERLLREFKRGDCQVLVATLGTGQRGLNLPEASTIIFASLDWEFQTLDQAIARVLRPEQREAVQVYTLELPGIDSYQRQMIEYKEASADCALDYGAGLSHDAEFFHFDHLINLFCESITGMRLHEAHKALCAQTHTQQ